MGMFLGKAAPHASSSAPNRLPSSTTALCLAKAAPDPSSMPSWPDLPPDVAGLVLCRLTSQADRLRFGAVCRDWRKAARGLRGTTPWLNIGPGVYQSLDGEVHRFRCHGSSGCLLFYYGTSTHGVRCVFLRNPFHASSASIEILWPCREPAKIIILCSSLSVAAILHRGICTIAPFWPGDVCRPEEPQHPWLPLIGDVVDMAFYHGKIFTVARSGELISHDLFTRRRETIVNSSMGWERDQPADNTVCHLIVSADTRKLLMVRWSIPPRKPTGRPEVDDHHRAMDLHVFEADLSKGKWSEVKKLGGQSLVLSRSCCRAFGSMDPRFSQGNRVYILGIDWHQKRTMAGFGTCKCRDCRAHAVGGIPSYCVYDMMTRTVSLVTLGGGHGMDGAMSEWFFPCE